MGDAPLSYPPGRRPSPARGNEAEWQALQRLRSSRSCCSRSSAQVSHQLRPRRSRPPSRRRRRRPPPLPRCRSARCTVAILAATRPRSARQAVLAHRLHGQHAQLEAALAGGSRRARGSGGAAGRARDARRGGSGAARQGGAARGRGGDHAAAAWGERCAAAARGGGARSRRSWARSSSEDAAQAFAWFKRSADLNQPTSLTLCRLAYLRGDGVKCNIGRGFIMLGRAAELQGDEQACYRLGSSCVWSELWGLFPRELCDPA